MKNVFVSFYSLSFRINKYKGMKVIVGGIIESTLVLGHDYWVEIFKKQDELMSEKNTRHEHKEITRQ